MKKGLFAFLLMAALLTGSILPVSAKENTDENKISEWNRKVEKLAAEYEPEEEKLENVGTGIYASSYDPRTVGKVTSVKDQGEWGLCWDYAALATCESSLIASGLADNSIDLSELHMAYFTYLDKWSGTIPFTVFCNGGSNATELFELIKGGIGPVLESDVPMVDITDEITVPDTYKYSHAFELEGYYAVDMSDPDAVKALIMEHGGVAISYYDYSEYRILRKNEDASYYFPYTNVLANHGIEIVGWDDNYSASNFKVTPKGNGAWLCKNSWGTAGYGSGFEWISYYDGVIPDVKGLTVSFVPNGTYSTEISLDQTHIELRKTETAKLSAIVYPETAANKNCTYISSNESVVTVDGNGMITAVGYGTADITVKASDGHSEAVKCSVTVQESPVITVPTQENTVENNNNKKQNASVGDVLKIGIFTYKVTGSNQLALQKAAMTSAVSVPDQVAYNGKKYKVTGISQGAFANHKKTRSITIGKNVISIGKNAFYGCKALTKFTIPEGVTSIGSKAFYNCRRLKKVTIKSTKLKIVGKSAFRKTAKKTTIQVPAGKKSVYAKLLKKKINSGTILSCE